MCSYYSTVGNHECVIYYFKEITKERLHNGAFYNPMISNSVPHKPSKFDRNRPSFLNVIVKIKSAHVLSGHGVQYVTSTLQPKALYKSPAFLSFEWPLLHGLFIRICSYDTISEPPICE